MHDELRSSVEDRNMWYISFGKIISSIYSVVASVLRRIELDYITLVLSAQRVTTSNYLLGPSNSISNEIIVGTKQVYCPIHLYDGLAQFLHAKNFHPKSTWAIPRLHHPLWADAAGSGALSHAPKVFRLGQPRNGERQPHEPEASDRRKKRERGVGGAVERRIVRQRGEGIVRLRVQ